MLKKMKLKWRLNRLSLNKNESVYKAILFSAYNELIKVKG